MLAEKAVEELQTLFRGYYVCFENLKLSLHVPQDASLYCLEISQDHPVSP